MLACWLAPLSPELRPGRIGIDGRVGGGWRNNNVCDCFISFCKPQLFLSPVDICSCWGKSEFERGALVGRGDLEWETSREEEAMDAAAADAIQTVEEQRATASLLLLLLLKRISRLDGEKNGTI